MKRNDCIFCQRSQLSILVENKLAFTIRDQFPARPLHTLIIPKRHVADIFETNAEEREAIHALAMLCRNNICDENPDVEGFNFGSNVVIPRRLGDAELLAARPD